MQSFLANKPSYAYKKASFLKRLAAFYLAIVFVTFFSYLLSYIISELGLFDITLYSKSFWSLFLLVSVFGFLTDGFFQCLLKFNLAKFILGLRVVDEREFETIGFFRALLRTIFAFVSFLFGGLGFIAILFNREKLSLHDMLAHSVVIDMSQGIFTRVISALTAFIIAIPGLIISVAFMLILISSPLFIWTSVKDYQNQQTIEISEWFDKPKLEYSINLHDDEGSKEVTFLIVDTGNYHENFKVQANTKESTVNIYDFDLLSNFAKIKFDLEKFLDSRAVLQSFYLKFDKIVFKTTANYDLSIRNARFYLAYENILANDLLSTFKYNVVEQEDKLKFSLSDNLRLILKENKFGYMLKNEYIKAIYHIEEKWVSFLKELDVQEKAELMDSKKKLANNIRIIVDFENGYIKQYDIIHPGENQLFNRITNRFLKDLQFQILDPGDLSPEDIKNNTFNLTLKYIDLI